MSDANTYPDKPSDGLSFALSDRARSLRYTCQCGHRGLIKLAPADSRHYDGVMGFNCSVCKQSAVSCVRVYEIYRTLMLERLVFLGDDAV